MGWTYCAASCSPTTREEERAEIERLYTDLVDAAPCTAECLVASRVGTTWYLAIRLAAKPDADMPGPVLFGCVPDTAGTITYAGVVLTGRARGEWGYKSLCGTMGPHEAEAPLRLLALLSPLDERNASYAPSWRERVVAHHAARRGRLTIRPSDRFETETPFRFDAHGGGTFEARRSEALREERRGRRAQTLYRTLDTPSPQVVAIPRRVLHAARPRLLEAEPASG